MSSADPTSVDGGLPSAHAPLAGAIADDASTEMSRFYPPFVISIDPPTQVVLLQVLDPQSGEVKRQWPPEHQLEAYRRQMQGTAPEGQQDLLPGHGKQVFSEGKTQDDRPSTGSSVEAGESGPQLA